MLTHLRIRMTAALYLSILCTQFSVSLFAENNADASEQLSKESSVDLVGLFAWYDELLSKLEAAIQYQAGLEKNNASRTADERNNAINWYNAATSCIAACKQIPYTTLTQEDVARRIRYISYIAERVNIAIERGITNTRMPSIADMEISLRTTTAITPEALVERLQKTESVVSKIVEKVESNGLRPYQRHYNNFVHFWNRYHVGQWIKTVGSATFLSAAGYYTWRKMFAPVPMLFTPAGKTTLAAQYDTAQIHALLNSTPIRNAYIEELKKMYPDADPETLLAQYGGSLAIASKVTGKYAEKGRVEYNVDDASPLGDRYVVNAEDLIERLNQTAIALQPLGTVGIAAGIVESQLHPIRTIMHKFRALHAHLSGAQNLQREMAAQRVFHTTLNSEEFAMAGYVRERLQDVLKFAMNPELYLRSGVKPQKAIMLTGPSGVGKSYFAEAFAGSFVEESKALGLEGRVFFHKIMAGYFYGHNDDPVLWIKNLASSGTPCIIYIDEMHSFNLQTSGNEKLLSSFLDYLDELARNDDPNHLVIIIAATNRPDFVDSPVYRSGRFEVINIDYPSYEARLHLLQLRCKENAIDTTLLNLERIAHNTAGATFSDINLLFHTALGSARGKGKAVQAEHFYAALNSVIRKLRGADQLNKTERSILSAHLAGMALASLLLKPAATHLDCITIEGHPKRIQQRNEWLTLSMQVDPNEQHRMVYGALFGWRDGEKIDVQHKEDQPLVVQIALAGRVAQEILLGSTTGYGMPDEQRAIALSHQFHGIDTSENAEKTNLLSKEMVNERKQKSFEFVEQQRTLIRTLLQEHRADLEKIAAALGEHTTLKCEDLEQILQQ